MASLNWKIGGVNRDQIANEIATLRANSPTFRRLEQMAWDRGYRSAEVTMGARILEENVADSRQSSADHSVRQIRIRSDATGTFGIGGRAVTGGGMKRHQLAHRALPRGGGGPGERGFLTPSQAEACGQKPNGA